MNSGQTKTSNQGDVLENPDRTLGFADRIVRAGPSLIIQAVVVLVVVWIIHFLAGNALRTLASQGSTVGFSFLFRPSNFSFVESFLPFSPTDTVGWAFLVGLSNTLAVTVVSIVLAVAIGIVISTARMSDNALLARLARVYVECMRNVPLLLHICLWYAIIALQLPAPRNAMQPVEGIFLSNRGIQFPKLVLGEGSALPVMMLIGALGVLLWLAFTQLRRSASLRLHQHGLAFGLGAIAVAALGIFLLPSLEWSTPELRGFKFVGGARLSAEFTSMTIALSTYTGAFISEVIRSGIQSVHRGQDEAARSLGMSRRMTFWLVIIPQALRVILPPTTIQFVNLLKNSSLSVAIGYPDLVSVTNTALNNTGQAIECIAIMMAVYLTISATTAFVMGRVEARRKLVER